MDLYELREQTISLFVGGPVPPLYEGFPFVRDHGLKVKVVSLYH